MDSFNKSQPIDLIDTISPGKFFSTPSDRNDVLSSYRVWLAMNKPVYVKYFTILAIFFMAIMIPFDFILFPDGLVYARVRVIFIIILLINIIILSKWKLRIPADGSRDYPVAQLLLPGVLMCLVYEYWLLTAFGDLYGTVLIANFMVIFSTTFFYHRFWREKYILNSIGIFGLIAFLWMIFAMVKDSLKVQNFIKDDFLKAVHLGFFCGIIAFLIHSAFEVSLYSLRLAMIFWCSLGALMAISRIGNENAA